MKESVRKEVESLIKLYSFNCDVDGFIEEANFYWISGNPLLSEDFIR